MKNKVLFALLLAVSLAPVTAPFAQESETPAHDFFKPQEKSLYFDDKPKCEIFEDCAAQDRVKFEKPAPAPELENKFSSGRGTGKSLSGIAADQLRP